jgi:phosphoserine phosphatase
LIDCDRTATAEDTTIPFFELNGWNLTALKNIFADDSYSHYQFWKQAKLYKDFSKYPNIADFHLNSIVCDKISSLKKQDYIVYGLTSGVFEIWKQINEKYQLFESIIGNDLSDSGIIISDFVKGFVSKLLKQKGYSVVSIGDSMCDIFMLEEANKGYIYAPNKLRPHVQKYIDEHSKTKIVQFARNSHQYAGILSEE